MPNRFNQPRLLGRDVEQNQRRPFRDTSVCFPGLHELRTDVEISREDRLRSMEGRSDALYRAAVQRGWWKW